ncbi:hypothetical protein [Virgisporangium aurantiacum]|uniref:Membrane protein n=1 Tax=Virgisporangium aurantiacum TaxID=175570 RepID=A0A8J3YXP8_9ACTN|nr:hypothetical protein [Virgisporangium aurantiacum]GIJ53581.1 membrane protein [Virgisporangium aurantiacum]
MSEHDAVTPRRTPPVAVVLAAVVAVQALLMLWFAWPAQKAEPRDLPVVVAGPQQAADALAAKLGAAREGAFDVTTVADAAAADAALTDRTAYAAFIVSQPVASLGDKPAAAGVEVHVASAASPAVATALSQLAAQMQAQFGQPGGPAVKVVDVVPTSADDPRGAGFAGSFLPLILTSIGAGVVVALLARSRPVRVAAIVGYGAGAGLLAAGLMHWTGVLAGSYLGGATAIALLTGSIAATVAGLYALLGRPGIALGAVLAFVVGNPLSGLATAPEMLPQPWGEIGQFLPVGAGATLIRSASYFDWAGATRSAIVLASYVVVGLILVATAGARRRRPAPAEAAPELVAA